MVGATSAEDNVAVGAHSSQQITTGFQNVSVGSYSLQDLTTGEHNVAVGYNALNEETIGDYNVAIGHSALQYASQTYSNIAIGKNALAGSASAPFTESYNVAVGDNALSAATSARGNSVFGYNAGNAITTGDYNIVLGFQADASTPTVNDEITLGNDNDKSFRIPGSSFYINGGSESTTGTRVGINTSSPAAQLHVSGDTQVDGTITADGLNLGDNEYIRLGASNDLQIYHDGFNSYIHDNGTGNLNLRATDHRIEDGSGNAYLIGTAGTVYLYKDGSQKLVTTSTGVSVTGSVELNGWTVTESGGSLYFATGGNNKMKLDASGNLQVAGDVESNAQTIS
jgi:hypothetical protein